MNVSLFSLAAFFVLVTQLSGVSRAESGAARTLEAAQASGAPAVLHFHAGWCPVCKRQQKVLKEMSQDPRYAEVAFVEADFDRENALRKKFQVMKQSTLIVFRGNSEIARSTGETDPAKLKSAVGKALPQ